MVYGAAMVIAVPALTIGVSRLKPAAPTIEMSTVWADTVKLGPMVRDVRGIGTLVPVDVQWIPAQSSARVDKIVLQSGASVKPDSIILELSDTQLELDALDAEYAYKAGQADLANLKVQLSSGLMAEKSTAADIESEYQQANMQADVDKQLSEEGIEAALTAKKSAVVAEQLGIKEGLVQEQLKIADDAAKAQVARKRRISNSSAFCMS